MPQNLLFLQMHRVTYLVNFHPKQSQKTMSRFTPPLYFLAEIWIAIAALPQTKPICLLLFYLPSNHCEFVLSLYSLYNSKSILVRELKAVATISFFKWLGLYCMNLPGQLLSRIRADEAAKKPGLPEMGSSGITKALGRFTVVDEETSYRNLKANGRGGCAWRAKQGASTEIGRAHV